MKKFILVALVAILGTASAVAQTPEALVFTIENGQPRTTIRDKKTYEIPSSIWSIYREISIDLVNGVEPIVGFQGWTESNNWLPMPGSGIPTHDFREQYLSLTIPGMWRNFHPDYDYKILAIRRIADPTLTVGPVSKPLSEWGNNPTIDVPRGTNVQLVVDQFFVSGGGSSVLRKDDVLYDRMKSLYDLTDLGTGNVSFELWTGDGVSFSETYKVLFTLVYEAAPVVTYVITATADANSSINPGTMTINAGGNQTYTWSFKPGYELYQLLIDGVVTNVTGNSYSFTNVTANRSISITSKPIVYTITYNLNGGTGATNGTYTIESPTITLPIPNKDGNDFKGWYDNASFTGSPITTIPTGSAGNKAFWAKWEVIAPTQYTISTSSSPSNGGTTTGGGTFNSGTSQTVRATANPGYTFVNWTENGAQMSTDVNYTFTLEKNRNLVANFQVAPVPVTGVTLNHTTWTAKLGDPTLTLVATVQPTNATNQAVTWSTSNANVATVTNGIVTFVGAGNATITVTTQDGAKTATCNVTVTVPVTGVTVDPTTATLTVGQTRQLIATVAPGNATNRTVTWTSNNENVANVSASGLVTAKAAGSAEITVKTADGNFTATCTVTVNAVVQPPIITTQPVNQTISVGGTINFSVVATGTNLSYQWRKDGVNIPGAMSASYSKTNAQVSDAGKYTVVVSNTAGSVTSNEVTLTVNPVSIPVTGVILDQTNLIQTIGDPLVMLTATVQPTNATNQAVTWSTSNANVATVTNGMVTFVGVGEAIITVTTQDGGKTATCHVTIKDVQIPTYTLTVNNGSGSGNYAAGTVVTITANPAPTGEEFDQWTGNTSGIADVNAASTTITMGTADATITATYRDLPPQTFSVTVISAGTGATGSDTYEVGTTVTISAGNPPSGHRFVNWTTTSPGVSFADANAATTTFLMPSHEVNVTANFERITSIHDPSTANLKIYPNPFVEMVKITGAEGCVLQVISASGIVMHTIKISDQEETLGLGNLPVGLYLFRLEKNGETTVQKVVKY